MARPVNPPGLSRTSARKVIQTFLSPNWSPKPSTRFAYISVLLGYDCWASGTRPP